MRRFPCSWSTVLAQLGFKRRLRKQSEARKRKARVEQLEARQLLSVSPNSQPEYVLASWAEDDTPEQFVISTEYDVNDSPVAVISLAPGLSEVDTTLQELELELRDGSTVLEHQQILIDLTDSDFKQRFYQDRVEATIQETVPAAVTEAQLWLNELTETGEFIDLIGTPNEAAETAKRLEALARLEREPDVAGADEQDRTRLYTSLGRLADDVHEQFEEVTSYEEYLAATELSDQVGRSGLLFGEELQQDLSGNTQLSAAAENARAAVFHASDSYHTLFAGYDLNREITRLGDSATNVEFVMGFVEEGTYVASDRLRFEVGSFDAGVQALIYEPGMTASAALSSVLVTFDTSKDATIKQSDPTGNYGSDTELTVSNLAGGASSALVGIDLTSYAGKVPDKATLNLRAITGSGENILSAHKDLWEVGPTSTWQEGSVDWQQYEQNLQDDFRDLPDSLNGLQPWTVTSAGQSVPVDVTEAVQRALLLGDSNINGDLDLTGPSGDIESFYQAVTNWSGYHGLYNNEVQVNQGLLYRNDANWDGEINIADTGDFFSRLGALRGDFNLDGVVDMRDVSILSDNFGENVSSFGQGDASPDGIVNISDFSVLSPTFEQYSTSPNSPLTTFLIEPTASSSAGTINYASKEHATTAYRPKLEVEFASRVNITGFSGNGQDLVVNYGVEFEDADDPQLSIYKLVDGVKSLLVTKDLDATKPTAGQINVNHTEIISLPNAIINPEEEFTLVAEIASENGVTRSLRLEHGIFKDGGDQWHVHGTAGIDQVAIFNSYINFTGHSLVNVTGATSGVYLHLGDGNDELGWINPTITGEVVLGGGAGDDVYLVIADSTSDRSIAIEDRSGIDRLQLDFVDGSMSTAATIDLASQEWQSFSSLAASGTVDIQFTSPYAVDYVESFNGSILGRGYSEPITVDTEYDLVDNDLSANQPGVLGLSLREALLLAKKIDGANTVIDFDPSQFTSWYPGILVDSQLVIDSNVTIDGGGSVILSGNGESRVINVLAGYDVTLKNLTVADGYVLSNGAGVFNRGNLTLDTVTLRDNTAVETGNYIGGQGGGLYHQIGQLTVLNSTFENNKARIGGGLRLHLYNSATPDTYIEGSTFIGNQAVNLRENASTYATGAAMHVQGWYSTTTVTNSTFSGNNANSYGGGIQVATGANLKLVNSTLSENYAGARGGGISTPSNPKVTIQNSIIAGNTSGTTKPDVSMDSGSVLQPGSTNNLIGVNSNGRFDTNTNLFGDPGLMPLGDYGGATLTYALLPTSAAINAGDTSKALDSQGNPLYADGRGFIFQREVGSSVDIGAVEAHIIDNDGDVTIYGYENDEYIELRDSEVVFESYGGELIRPIDLTAASSIRVEALSGNDLIAVDEAFANSLTLLGGAGDDVIYGGANDDVLDGGDGNDEIYGRAGSDVISGGSGDDRLSGELGDDTLHGDAGADSLIGGLGADTKDGGVGYDHGDNDASDVSLLEIHPLSDVDVRHRSAFTQRITADAAGSTLPILALTGVTGPSVVQENVDYSFIDGLFQWHPSSNATPGTYSATIASGGVSQSFDIDIASYNLSNPSNVWQAIPIGASNVNATFTAHSWQTGTTIIYDDLNQSGFLTDSQSANSQLTYSVHSGNLAPGMTLASDGTIRWEVANNAAAGVWRAIISISDNSTDSNGSRSALVPLVTNIWHEDIDIDGGDNGEVLNINTNPHAALDDSFHLSLNESIPTGSYVWGNEAQTTDAQWSVSSFVTVSQPANEEGNFDINASSGELSFTPSLNGEGLATGSYRFDKNHILLPPGQGDQDEFLASTGSEALINIEVGKAVRADIDIDLPEYNPDATQEVSNWHTYDEAADTGDNKVVPIDVNSDDDDGNSVPDLQPTAVPGEDDLIPAKLGYWLRDDAEIGDFTAKLSASKNDVITVWTSETKEPGTELNLFGPNNRVGDEIKLQDLPEEVWVEGLASEDVSLSLTIEGASSALFTNMVQPQGGGAAATTDSDAVSFGAAGLTAYRPMHGPNTYTPFNKTAVPELWEDDPLLGPGIRVNGDYDGSSVFRDYTQSGTFLPGENDLIEVKVSVPAGKSIILETESPLILFSSYQKGLPLDLSQPLNSSTSIFVEWAGLSHGQAELRMIDSSSGIEVDSLNFHSFKSIIVGFSGETFGSFADLSDVFDRQATFRIAAEFYESGYDVHYYDVFAHDVLTGVRNIFSKKRSELIGPGVNEVIQALTNRKVSHISSFGWSHGGGAVNQLSFFLDNWKNGKSIQHVPSQFPPSFTLDSTVYIDAVRYVPGAFESPTLQPFAEYRIPKLTQAHGNWYQTIWSPFHGTSNDPKDHAFLQQWVTTPLNLVVNEDKTDELTEPLWNHVEIIRDAWREGWVVEFIENYMITR